MALTQMQIIQSLGEAMSWFERELNWGVAPTELRHLCGRIGELYAALITGGQMVTEVNQRGYDVVSGAGERVSVKTTARMGSGGHVSFNPSTLDLVDRVIVLRIDTEEMQIEMLLDATLDEAKALMAPVGNDGRLHMSVSKLARDVRTHENAAVVNEVTYHGYLIRELESGTIQVEKEGSCIAPSKPKLREFAASLGIGLLNSNGNKFNTRQLGSLVIKAVKETQLL